MFAKPKLSDNYIIPFMVTKEILMMKTQVNIIHITLQWRGDFIQGGAFINYLRVYLKRILEIGRKYVNLLTQMQNFYAYYLEADEVQNIFIRWTLCNT